MSSVLCHQLQSLMSDEIKSVTTEEVDDKGFKYVLVTTTFKNGEVRKVLKSLRLHQVETAIGRNLEPGETGFLTPNGPIVKRSGLSHPRMEMQVKDVPGPTSDYFMISEEGHLISKRNMKIVKDNPLNGYPAHVTKVGGREGKNYAMKLHLCVAKAFLPNPDNKPEVNHLDGDKHNPSIQNLEWSTGSANIQHAVDMGLLKQKKGLENSSAALTPEMQSFILEHQTSMSGSEMAKKLGISRWTVNRFLNGSRY